MLADIISPDLFASAIRMATPIALAAIGGTICERAGVVNIALEGMMLFGAFMGVIGAMFTGSAWIGVLTAVVAGAALALVHAFASITLRTDQVVSGTAINILALGLTGFLMEVIFGHPGTTDPVTRLGPVFDFSGPQEGMFATAWRWFDVAVMSYTPLVYVAILLAIASHWALFNTRWGLRLRALGEHPRAADTVGINVIRGRYSAVIASGALAGMAGANLTLEQTGSFTEGMTNARGFIALAANIFGRWTPGGSYGASLLFGFADALQIKMQLLREIIKVPSQFFLMIPYVLTVVVLAGVVGRAVAPAAIGKPYEKG
ncbi:MAG: ABC transporter permease [Clostridiales bacterium]|nr:ABC transporter permease [Clostridiales bacterium]